MVLANQVSLGSYGVDSDFNHRINGVGASFALSMAHFLFKLKLHGDSFRCVTLYRVNFGFGSAFSLLVCFTVFFQGILFSYIFINFQSLYHWCGNFYYCFYFTDWRNSC